MYNSQILSKFSLFAANTILMFMLMPCLLSGCGAFFIAGAGAGTYAYVSGNVTRTYSAGYQETINACMKVLNKKEIDIIEKSGDALKTKIESKRHDDTTIIIEIEQISSNLSRVNIRSGFMGTDQKTASELIHDYIHDELEKPLTPVKIISPKSYKVKVLPAETARPFEPYPNEKSAPYSRDQYEAAVGTDDLEKAQKTAPPHSPLYIFYNDQEIDIPQNSLAELKSIVHFLKNTSFTVDIRSYTDSHGAAEDNLKISWKRANALKDYLIQNGIAYERITVRGFGASNFLWSNKTETLRKMNRRVVLYIHPQ